MDKTLTLKKDDFQKALATLREVLAQKDSVSDIMRDALIQRFEYTVDAGWKTAKALLLEKFGVEVYSPKECFRELRRNQLMSDEDTEACLLMVDDRNAVVHTYGRQMADKIAKKIKESYAGLLQKVAATVENACLK